jgi:hypothetical protein
MITIRAATATGAAATTAGATETVAATGTAAVGNNAPVPRPKLLRGVGPVGVALTAWDLWRRLPPRQRRWVLKQARKHGPRLAKQVYTAQQRGRKK